MFYVGTVGGIRNLGTYAAGTTYFPNDLVQYQSSTFIATTTTLGHAPTDTDYWAVLAAAPASTFASDTKWGTD